MAKKLALSLFICILTANAEIINCGTGPECNCSTTPGETCILNCNSADICKGKTLNCRSGDSCYIHCESSASCSDKTRINAQTSTDVTIICEGSDACKTGINITCGTGKCTLRCDSDTSCNNWGHIDVTKSLEFKCIGGYCPESSLPLYFTASPTSTPTFSPTFSPTYQTQNPTNRPSYNPVVSPTYNPTITPTNHPTITPSNHPIIRPTNHATITPTKYPTYLATIYPTYVSKSNNKLGYKRGLNFHDHDHYATDPLFYVIATLLIIILCACCCLCIWIYNKEQQQKRIQHKLNSKSAENIPHKRSYSNTNTNTNTTSNDSTVHINKKYNKHSSSNPNLMTSSMDNSSELYGRNEGPIPTYVKINTSDLNSHISLMNESKSNPMKPKPILLPSQINNNINPLMSLHTPSDGSTTKPLPMPPPRRSLPVSPYGMISNFSSPPQTPIPETTINNNHVNNIINNINNYNQYKKHTYSNDDDIYDDIKTEYLDLKQANNNNSNTDLMKQAMKQANHSHMHGKYASLPTIPSLPAITPECSMSSQSHTEMNLAISTNAANITPNVQAILNNSNNSMHSIRISMVFDDSNTNIIIPSEEEEEESEYQSHRKQTFESYDMGNNSPHSKPFPIANKSVKQSRHSSKITEFDISAIGKASTIRLDDIIEDSKNSVASTLSETSISNNEDSSENNLTEMDLHTTELFSVASNTSTKL